MAFCVGMVGDRYMSIEVGNRIKNIRLSLGMTMEEFANEIDNKSKSGTVSNWETGKNLPNAKRLKKIAELGDTTVQELLKEDDCINVGYAIKELRDSYRETQQQFADRIGISKSYVSELESNKRSVSVRTLSQIADKLNMKLDIRFVK